MGCWSMATLKPNCGWIQHDAVFSHAKDILMAEVVEPLGGLIALRDMPIQPELPVVADTGYCTINPALTKQKVAQQHSITQHLCSSFSLVEACQFAHVSPDVWQHMFLYFVYICV